jgi:hypothetical protein
LSNGPTSGQSRFIEDYAVFTSDTPIEILAHLIFIAEELNELRGQVLNVHLRAFLEYGRVEVEQQSYPTCERIYKPVHVSQYVVIICYLGSDHAHILDPIRQSRELLDVDVSLEAVPCLVGSKQTPLLIENDLPCSLIVLLEEQIMFLSEHVRHQYGHVLAHNLLPVPSKTLFEAVTYFKHPATGIFVPAYVQDYSLIAE